MDGDVRPTPSAGYLGDGLESGSSPLSTPRRSPELSSISPAAPSFGQNNHRHVPSDENIIRVGGAHPASVTPAAVAPKQRKPRAPRKPKDENAVSSDNAVKEKKPRKPREPRDPNKPVRKRQKIEAEPAAPALPPQPAGQPLSRSLQHTMPPHSAHALAQQQQQQQQPPPNHVHPHLTAGPPPTASINPTRPTSHEPVRDGYPPPPHHAPAPAPGIPPLPVYHRTPAPAPRPTSSGQMYDPIRSSTADKIVPLPNYHQSPSTSPSQHAYLAHARASPSIASLIDPPPFDGPSPDQSPSRALLSRPAIPTDSIPSYSMSGASVMQRTASGTSAPLQPAAPTSIPASAPVARAADAMDVDSTPLPNGTPTASGPTATAPATTSAPAPAPAPPPKPPRARPKSPPLPLGSGLLSSALFNGADAPAEKYDEVPNQCIIIDVPMVPGKVNFVNFIREVENKYGFDVAHPRLAEHRRRMRQMAAAGAALESGSGSGDDMGVDISADEDSNAETGGAGGGGGDNDSAAPATGKKKRRPKGNEYDKSDDFIDDTELLWEEQALASKDGYFVWSGPLARDGEKQTIERADGTVRRGRGGRGRGGSTRGGGEGSTRGRTTGGRGSRGGATVRRPRGAKAALKEQERVEKEKAASLTNGAGPLSVSVA